MRLGGTVLALRAAAQRMRVAWTETGSTGGRALRLTSYEPSRAAASAKASHRPRYFAGIADDAGTSTKPGGGK